MNQYETTRAKTDRGKCKSCRKPIPAGTIKVIVSPGYRPMSMIQYKYTLCGPCGKKYIDEDINRLNNMKDYIDTGKVTYVENTDWIREKRAMKRKMKEDKK